MYSTASHSRLAQSSRGQQEDDDDDDDDGAAPYNEASTYQHFGQMNRAVIRGVKRMIASMEQEEAVATTNGDASKESGHDDDEEETAIVKVLSMALNRESASNSNTASTHLTDLLNSIYRSQSHRALFIFKQLLWGIRYKSASTSSLHQRLCHYRWFFGSHIAT